MGTHILFHDRGTQIQARCTRRGRINVLNFRDVILHSVTQVTLQASSAQVLHTSTATSRTASHLQIQPVPCLNPYGDFLVEILRVHQLKDRRQVPAAHSLIFTLRKNSYPPTIYWYSGQRICAENGRPELAFLVCQEDLKPWLLRTELH